MTLSVFRQLLREDVLDLTTGVLQGDVWGRVNYFWTGCGLEEEHLHVVWQKGDELRRACVTETRPRWFTVDNQQNEIWWYESIDALARLVVLLRNRTVNKTVIPQDVCRIKVRLPGERVWNVEVNELRWFLRQQMPPEGIPLQHWQENREIDFRRLSEEAIRESGHSRNWNIDTLTLEVAEQELCNEIDAVKMYQEAQKQVKSLWAENYQRILVSPHLFIAV